MYLHFPGGGGGTGGVCGIMDRRVTDSELNVKPLFKCLLFSELAPRHCRPVASNKVWAMAIDSHGQD